MGDFVKHCKIYWFNLKNNKSVDPCRLDERRDLSRAVGRAHARLDRRQDRVGRPAGGVGLGTGVADPAEHLVHELRVEVGAGGQVLEQGGRVVLARAGAGAREGPRAPAGLTWSTSTTRTLQGSLKPSPSSHSSCSAWRSCRYSRGMTYKEANAMRDAPFCAGTDRPEGALTFSSLLALDLTLSQATSGVVLR